MSIGNDKLLRKEIGIWSLAFFIVTLFSLSVYSTEWVRMKFLEYYFNNKYYDMAIDSGIKIIRKGTILGKLDNESMNRICLKLDDLMAILVERQIAFAKNQWNQFRTFFAYDKTNLGGIDSLFDKIRFFLGTKLLNEFPAWKRYLEYCESRKPYIALIGFSDNDLNPAHGILTNFNYTGGFALDYNFRSIGANLLSRKPVVAIRLRRWNQETRVKPENLSIWISDDNKVFRRYIGQITFSNEARAMTLDHLLIVCQFIKIHCDFRDEKSTFAENFRNILSIYGPPFIQ